VNIEVEVIWKEGDIAADIPRRRRGTQRKASVTRLDYLVWLLGMQHDDSSRLQVFYVMQCPVFDNTVM
jgi:hypothetical protein